MSGLKNSVLKFGYRAGAFRIAQWMTSRVPRILVYHAFSEEVTASEYHLPQGIFRRQLEHVAKRYKVIPLVELAESIAAGKPLPPNSLAITVDDGYENFYRLAYPLLCEFRMPATVFVITRLLEQDGWTWACSASVGNGEGVQPLR